MFCTRVVYVLLRTMIGWLVCYILFMMWYDFCYLLLPLNPEVGQVWVIACIICIYGAFLYTWFGYWSYLHFDVGKCCYPLWFKYQICFSILWLYNYLANLYEYLLFMLWGYRLVRQYQKLHVSLQSVLHNFNNYFPNIIFIPF